MCDALRIRRKVPGPVVVRVTFSAVNQHADARVRVAPALGSCRQSDICHIVVGRPQFALVDTCTPTFTVGLVAETTSVSVTEVLPGALATTVTAVFGPRPGIVVLNRTCCGSFGLLAETVVTGVPFTVIVMFCAPQALPLTGIEQVLKLCPFAGDLTVRLSVPGIPTIMTSPLLGVRMIGAEIRAAGPLAIVGC